MIFTQSTHIWIINTADHRFRSIKDEEGGQVSSIAGNDNHGEPCPHHTEYTSTEATGRPWNEKREVLVEELLCTRHWYFVKKKKEEEQEEQEEKENE